MFQRETCWTPGGMSCEALVLSSCRILSTMTQVSGFDPGEFVDYCKLCYLEPDGTAGCSFANGQRVTSSSSMYPCIQARMKCKVARALVCLFETTQVPLKASG